MIADLDEALAAADGISTSAGAGRESALVRFVTGAAQSAANAPTAMASTSMANAWWAAPAQRHVRQQRDNAERRLRRTSGASRRHAAHRGSRLARGCAVARLATTRAEQRNKPPCGG